MAENENDGYYEVFWPRAALHGGVKPLAPRLDTLEGKTVLQLWDFLFHGDEVFELLEEGLKAKYPTMRFVSWREVGNILGANEREVIASLPRRLRELGVDAAITGMAA